MKLNLRGVALGFAIVLPLSIVGVADAAPKARAGTIALSVSQPDAPFQYPGSGNKNVDSVYFDVTLSGFRTFDYSRIGFNCYDEAGGLVYTGTRTVRQGYNGTINDFAVSLYVSTRDIWTGQAGVCDVTLYYDTWNRKTLHQFGGELDVLPGAFAIGPA
jgi:hypothetical protein